MIYDFDKWRANLVLEALHTLDRHWQALIDSTDDEDVKADYANDLIRLHILQEGFERKAVEEFGPNVTSFSREIVPIPTPHAADPLPTRKLA